MEWNAVYLSTNRDKEPILTLWLANSSETADFNYHSVNQNSIIPSNMYSTSMIRTVTLNNEGTWYETDTGKNPHNVTPKADHKYAKFTMTEEQGVAADAQALDAAKEMIDLREDQIERYQEYLKEQKSMKR